MRKTWLITFFLLSALIIGSFLLLKSKSKGQKTAYDLLTVKRGDIIFAVSADGMVEPNFEVDVKSRASGDIISFPYETGDMVKKGELLVKLDPIDEQRNVARKEATFRSNKAVVAKAKANLRDAEKKLERQRELFGKGMISEEELETAMTTYLQDKAEVEFSEAQVIDSKIALDDAKRRLADTEIRAPIDGTILTKDVEVGQIITSSIDIVGGGTKLLTLGDLSRIFVLANVDETDMGKIELGQEAVITVDAYPGKTFSGAVTHIAPKGTVEENVVTFEVEVEVRDKERQLLKTGMTANVKIIYLKRENSLWLPNEALVDLSGKTQHEGSMKKGVYKWVSGKPKPIPVECGVTDGITTEILGGISEGDEIVSHAAFVGEAGETKISTSSTRRFMRRVK